MSGRRRLKDDEICCICWDGSGLRVKAEFGVALQTDLGNEATEELKLCDSCAEIATDAAQEEKRWFNIWILDPRADG